MFRKKTFTTAALAALATMAGVSAASAQSTPPATTTSWSGAPETREGEQRFKIRGRFQYDIQANDWDVGTDDGTRSYVRRAFLGAQGRLTEHWRYKIDFVLSPGASEASSTTVTLPDCDPNLIGPQPCVATVSTSGGGEDVGVDDAYLEYVGDDWSIVIGEFNITSPLEDRISSLDIPFTERSSMINAFEYGRRAGIGFLTGGSNYSLSAAVQGDSLNNADSNFANDESIAVSGRATYAPIFETSPEGTTLVHLGLHARSRGVGDDSGIRYRTRPLNGRGSRLVDAGSGLLGEQDTAWGLEFAGQLNAFGVQAEYTSLSGEAISGAEYDFSGYYVDLYWSLTGESRNYRGNQGSFGAIVPRRPITDGGLGHWMLSARYDSLDLSDAVGGSSRGEQTAYAVGLDWVPLDHVRFKLNYALSDMDRTVGVDDEARVITLRTQFDF